jgi:hypothetical protein
VAASAATRSGSLGFGGTSAALAITPAYAFHARNANRYGSLQLGSRAENGNMHAIKLAATAAPVSSLRTRGEDGVECVGVWVIVPRR